MYSLDYEETFTAPSVATLVRRLPWLDKVGDPLTVARSLHAAMKRPITFRRGHHRSHAVHARMKELDAIAQTYGAESVVTRKRGYEYLNTGDPYTPTIMASYQLGRFYVGDWASLVENEGEGDPLYA